MIVIAIIFIIFVKIHLSSEAKKADIIANTILVYEAEKARNENKNKKSKKRDIKRTATCYECNGTIFLSHDKIKYYGSSGTHHIICPCCRNDIRLCNSVANPIMHEHWEWKQKNTYAR